MIERELIPYATLNKRFSIEFQREVDQAVCRAWEPMEPREDGYLATERVTYEILEALYKQGYRVVK